MEKDLTKKFMEDSLNSIKENLSKLNELSGLGNPFECLISFMDIVNEKERVNREFEEKISKVYGKMMGINAPYSIVEKFKQLALDLGKVFKLEEVINDLEKTEDETLSKFSPMLRTIKESISIIRPAIETSKTFLNAEMNRIREEYPIKREEQNNISDEAPKDNIGEEEVKVEE